MSRAILQTIRVQPGLNVLVEDSHNILLEITTPDGSQVIARTGPISNCDNITRALETARIFVRVFEENPEEAGA